MREADFEIYANGRYAARCSHSPYVLALRSGAVETFEPCECGEGHAFSEPTIRFHGDVGEGVLRLLAVNGALVGNDLHHQGPRVMLLTFPVQPAAVFATRTSVSSLG